MLINHHHHHHYLISSRIRDTSSVSMPSPRVPDHRHSPTHRSATLTWQMGEHAKPRQGNAHAPMVPPRSPRSLLESGTLRPEPPSSVPSSQIEAENPYLKIVGNSEYVLLHIMTCTQVPLYLQSYTIPF